MTLSKLARELDEARRDVALLQRLQEAQKRVEAASAAYENAKDAEERTAAEKAKAEHEARLDEISDLRVTESADPKGCGVLGSSFRITYTRPSWDHSLNRTVPKRVEVNGFGALCPPVLQYLIERAPEQIPASVMTLAPSDPEAALQRYFVGRRRGWISA